MAPKREIDIDWRPFGWSTPRLLLAGLVVVACVSLLVVASTSTAGFNPYNADWDGTGEFHEIADTQSELRVITDTEPYETVDPNMTTGFVFAPDREYNTTDVARVAQFVEAGGTLVVADNYGSNGNALLREVGTTARFNGSVLRDERHNFRSPAMPVATNTSSHRLVDGVTALTLNYATAVEPGDATPIVNSSEFAYLSEDGGERLDDETELQQYPVVTVETVGDGTVIVISDPSLFVNSMLDESDNRQFATALVDQRPVTLLDQSHTSSPPPLVAVLLAVRSSPLIAAGSLVVLIGLIVAVGRRPGRLERYSWRQWVEPIQAKLLPASFQSRAAATLESESLTADREALKAELRQRHPNWDDERLDRVIAGVLVEQPESSDNE